jgi:hypothetical protein
LWKKILRFTRRRDVTALGLDDHESNLVER